VIAPAITPGPTPSPTPTPERTSESGPTPASAGEGALAATTVQPVRTLVGVLMLTLLLGTVFNTFEMVRDREQRILHRLLVAPGGTVVYVAQHGLALALIALVQAMTGVAAIATAFGIDPAGALRLAVVILLFALTATALALAIAGWVNSLSEAALAAGFLILPLVMAGGGFWSSANMSRAAARLAYLLPTTWAMAAAEGVLDGAPLVSYSVHLLALGLFTAFLALLGPWKREDLGIR
jgi:ABC-type multidrug transport system permease subunit